MAKSETSSKSLGSLPDLYRLLELSPLESSHRVIESSLKRVLKAAREQQSSNPAKAKKAAKLLELGKRTLLDPQAKAAYDVQWSKLYGEAVLGDQDPTNAQSASAATVGLDWQWEQLTKHLPAGDPNSAFDLAAFLRETPTPEDNLRSDFEKLQNLLAGIDNDEERNAKVGHTAEAEQEPTQNTQHPLVAVPVAAPAAKKSGASSKSLANKIRKKRDRSLLGAVVGVAASLALIMGVLFFVLRQDTADPEPQTPKLAANQGLPTGNSAVAPFPKGNDARLPLSQGSGLPKVQGLEDPSEPLMESSSSDTASDATEANAAMPPAEESSGSMATDTSMPQASSEEMNPNPPAETSPQDSVLSESEKKAWQDAMYEIRSQITKQDYENAIAMLDNAQETAKTSPQVDQLIRLRRAGLLAEQCQNAIVEAIEGLSGGESFTVGSSTNVSFVEGNREAVTLRILGQNRTFRLPELKIGIASALADLKMEATHPSSVAAKAAFALFHAGSNDETVRRARSDMQTAIDAGQIPADTVAVFDDDYSL